jgi:hypothetical protein
MDLLFGTLTGVAVKVQALASPNFHYLPNAEVGLCYFTGRFRLHCRRW